MTRWHDARLCGPPASRRRSIAALVAVVLVIGGCGAASTPSAAPSIAPDATAISEPAATASPSPSLALRASILAPSPTPEGQISGLFDVGGRSLFLECRGTGSPTVVFLVGTGAPRTQMRMIEDGLLDDAARVCDYDRAGEGESASAAGPQTDVEVGDDLAALLMAAHVPPPYVLVGQSVGGDEAWLYANRHPAGVAGFLIMNAGFFVLDWDELTSVWSDAEIAEERALSEAGLGDVKQAASPPKGVPYVVMMSTIAQCASAADVCGRIYPFYEAWARELAKRSPNGRFAQVAAGHEIFDDRPDAVLAEIRRLLDAVR
jgi:alpha/beta hydrolase fold